MGFLDRIRAAFGGGEHLVEAPGQADRLAVDRLEVRTANLSPDTDEKLLIITTSPAALVALHACRRPLTLTNPSHRPVTFVPVSTAATPVLDPDAGWLIPVTPATARELAGLPAGPGEHELETLHLALVLEDAPRR